MSRIKDYAIKCMRDEAQAILNLIPLLDDNFDKAVELIHHCKGRLIVTGVGKSGHIGAKIAATLASTGTPSFFVNPLDAFHGDLGMFTSNDIALVISHSGQTDELLRFIPCLMERNIPIIGMTGHPDSLVAQYSTYHLNVYVEREACPLNLAPTSSTTASLAMGDALACALMEVRHFRAQDFARFHPGGTLGRRLLTRAKDVMRRDDLPVVSTDITLDEAIIHMSEGKLGLIVAIDNGEIKGIITDGDLRRIMQRSKSKFFDLKVAEVMTPNPKRIHPETKITEIEKMLNQYKIHSLLVVDENDRLIGIVDNFCCMI